VRRRSFAVFAGELEHHVTTQRKPNYMDFIETITLVELIEDMSQVFR
jgi:hypothetical protein